MIPILIIHFPSNIQFNFFFSSSLGIFEKKKEIKKEDIMPSTAFILLALGIVANVHLLYGASLKKYKGRLEHARYPALI